MNKKKLKGIFEAVLFSMGESVSIKVLAELVDCSLNEAKEILEEMDEAYRKSTGGIRMIWLDDSVQLATKPEYFEYVVEVAKKPRKLSLTETVLETLSIVAYKQPITRIEIEKVRGVKCDHAINKLIEYDLIQELGRLDAPGRPLLFGTTEQFLRCFGLKSLAEMPEIDHLQIEEFKIQAEDEINQKLQM